MRAIIEWAGDVTDRFEVAWESRPGRLVRSVVLVAVLLGGVALIELRRLDVLPSRFAGLPTNHLHAIAWTVTVLLVFEVVEMLLALGRSVADSVGRHLQLYALVLLRDAFLMLARLPEPIVVSTDQFGTVAAMGADAAGAVLLFLTAACFGRLQRHRPIVQDQDGVRRFRDLKKLVALVMLGVLTVLCVQDLRALVSGEPRLELLEVLFTVLVFVDVLLALISIAFTDVPAVIFRNFGFAFAAIVLRLAVAAPEFIRPGLGVIGGLVAIAVTVTYNVASGPPSEPAGRSPDEPQPEEALGEGEGEGKGESDADGDR